MHKERVKLRKLVKMQLWKRVFFHFENTKGYVNLPLRNDIFYFLTIFVKGSSSRSFFYRNYRTRANKGRGFYSKIIFQLSTMVHFANFCIFLLFRIAQISVKRTYLT